MRLCTAVLSGVLISSACLGQEASKPPASTSDASPTVEEILKKLDAVISRVDVLEAQHEQDQQLIHQLQEQLKAQQAGSGASENMTANTGMETAKVGGIQPGKTGTQTETPSTGQGNAAMAASPDRGVIPTTVNSANAMPSTQLGQGTLYNPQITVFFDMGASLSTNNQDERYNRFHLREAELDFRSAVSPYADGVLIASIAEQVNQTDTPDGVVSNIDTALEIEEGYLDLHTLPYDLTARVGKMRNLFGVNNALHTHDLPQIDRPLPVQAFLGDEGMSTVGASVSWLVPNPFDEFIELTGQVVNADGGEESPILGGANADNPAYLAHLKWFTDLNDDTTFELGTSYLFAHTSGDNSFTGNVIGLDSTLKWLDPDALGQRSFLAQGELFYADNDVSTGSGNGFRNSSFGAYAFAQYQPTENWYVGVRGDYTEYPNSDIHGPDDADWAVSPYVSWYLTEFMRLRLEYQFRQNEFYGDHDTEHNLFFGLTYLIGAHPPHPYWVNK